MSLCTLWVSGMSRVDQIETIISTYIWRMSTLVYIITLNPRRLKM